MKNKVHIMEVTPRDGLQNEDFMPTLEEKIELLERLVGCGFKDIEAGAFVSPKAVPQMWETPELFANLPDAPKVNLHALIPNLKGYELALEAGATHLGYVLAVTESLQQRNVNMSVEEGFEQLAQIAQRAQKDEVHLRAYLSVIFHCPFEGETKLEQGLYWVQRVADLGVQDICLADTDGNAKPDHAERLMEQATDFLQIMAYESHISLHLHDTYGYAEENLRRALKQGIHHFDSATAGMGGCPFAPGAKGNISSEKVVAICEKEGFKTGIDPEKLSGLSDWLKALKAGRLGA